jgi:hypothetical protein
MFIACGQSPIYTRILGCLRRGACYKRHDCLQEMQLLRERRGVYTQETYLYKKDTLGILVTPRAVVIYS